MTANPPLRPGADVGAVMRGTTTAEYAMGLVSLVGIVMGLLILVFGWHVLVWPLVIVAVIANALGLFNVGRRLR